MPYLLHILGLDSIGINNSLSSVVAVHLPVLSANLALFDCNPPTSDLLPLCSWTPPPAKLLKILLHNTSESFSQDIGSLSVQMQSITSSLEEIPTIQNLNHCPLYQFLGHIFNWPILFLLSLAYGTGNNPEITTLEVQLLKRFPNSLYYFCKISFYFLPVISTDVHLRRLAVPPPP